MADPAWTALVVAYHSAREERQRLYDPYQDAEQRYFDEAPPRPADPFVNALREARGAIIDEAALVKTMLECGRRLNGNDEYQRLLDQWNAACASLHHQLVEEPKRAYDVAVDRAHDLMREIITYPAHDLKQLAQKVGLIRQEYPDDFGNGDELLHVAADVERLAGVAE